MGVELQPGFVGLSQVRQIRSDRQVALGTRKAVGLGVRLAGRGPSLDINHLYAQILPVSKGSQGHEGGLGCLEVRASHQPERQEIISF